MSSWSRAALAAALAATLGGWLVAALTPRDFTVGTFSDDAQYAVLAKALREQHAYRDLSIPGRPPEIKYPPLWPAVLALAWKSGASGDANLERLRWVNLAIVGPLAGLLALAGLRVFRLSPVMSALAAVTGIAAPATMRWWTIPMSEPLCLAFLIAGLLLVEAGRFRGAAAALALAVYVRSLAAPFLAALPIVCAWNQGWRRALAPAAVGVALLLPWAVQVLVHRNAVPPVLFGAAGSYAAWYAQSLAADPATMLFTVPYVNLPLVAQALGEGLLGWHWAPRAVEIALGAAVAALAGRAGRSRPLLGVGLGLYVLVVLFWPFPQQDRFVGSVWPLLFLAALAALPWLRARWTLLGVAVLAAALAFARSEGVERHRLRSRTTLALLDSVRARIPPGSVVAASNPALVYLRLGTPSVVNWRFRSYRWYRLGYWASAWGLGDDLWAIIRAYRPGYIIIERRGAEGRYAVGSIRRQCPGVLTELWRSAGEEMLFAVHPDVPCTPAVVPR